MNTKLSELDEFTRGYITAAFWTMDDESPSGDYETSGRPEVMFERLDKEARARMFSDCSAFVQKNGTDFVAALNEGMSAGKAGQNFWLTRNRHGAGFWDGDLSDDLGKRLTDAAHSFGDCDLYSGDDGKLYIA